MARTRKKKPGTKKTPARRRFSLTRNLKRGLFVVALLCAAALVAGLVAYVMLSPPPPAVAPSLPKVPSPLARPTVPPPATVPTAPETVAVPAYEVFPKEEMPPIKAIAPPKPPHAPRTHGPRVTIIIDDIGYVKPVAERFIDFHLPLTLAVFPFSPHGRQIAEKARQKGLDVMLHLPMEPNEYPAVDPGQGALLTRMTPDQIIETLRANLDQIEGIKGVNNHMGSRLTADADKMNQVFTVLKQQGLYFVDSRTTAASITYQAARLLQVPYAHRDVFLDNVQTHEAVRRQVNLLVETARKKGEAVGIGHPYPVTYEVLREMLPELTEKVRLVTASEAVRILQ